MTASAPAPVPPAEPPQSPAPSATHPRAKLPGKVVIGLIISALLLLTAVLLEITRAIDRHAITTRTPADPAADPMLQSLPPNTRLPSQAELTPPLQHIPPGLSDTGDGGDGGDAGGPAGLPPGHPHLNSPPAGPGPLDHGAATTPTDTPETEESLARRGHDVVLRLKCIVCHSEDGKPLLSTSFLHLYGKQSTLTDGRKITVDDAYIRESILDPQAKIVAGPKAAMPSYKGQVTEHDLKAIVAYLKSLAEPPAAPPGQP